MSKAIRWSHDDRYFGPFTYAYEPRYRKIALMLGSGDGDDYPGCRLRIAVGAHTLIVALPALIKPWRRWHDITTEPTRTQMLESGRQPGYWDQHEREFGFSVAEGSVHFHYGPQTHDSETTKSKVWFIPWKSARLVRTSHYDLAGEHFVTIPPRGRMAKIGKAAWRNHWTVEDALQGACPTASFLFGDFDGEQIIATTRIDEREWAKGEGKFKWLSLFCRNKVARSLNISFSAEVGRKKGSWKGGTIGHSINMLPGELHEAAFKRYCGENGLTFICSVERQAASG
jgi:hypothetical protein